MPRRMTGCCGARAAFAGTRARAARYHCAINARCRVGAHGKTAAISALVRLPRRPSGALPRVWRGACPYHQYAPAFCARMQRHFALQSTACASTRRAHTEQLRWIDVIVCARSARARHGARCTYATRSAAYAAFSPRLLRHARPRCVTRWRTKTTTAHALRRMCAVCSGTRAAHTRCISAHAYCSNYLPHSALTTRRGL